VKEKIVHVDGYVEVDFNSRDSMNFILWKNSTIEKVEINTKECEYIFDTVGPSPNMFIRNGKHLIVKKPISVDSNVSIHFIYTSDMSYLRQSWEGVFSDEWIELAMYSAWYPFHAGIYTAHLNIYIDEGYIISGSGLINRKDDYWEYKKNWRSFDIVLIASSDLKSREFIENNTGIQLDYTNLSASDADSVINECKFAYELFEEKFGKKGNTNIKFVMGPQREGGGYSRKYFVSMPGNEFNFNTRFGNAHEIAHFWWLNAPVNTWEDWLNEAFAQYSALLYIRERLGNREFRTQIQQYEETIDGTPPIWGIDRNSQQAYHVLYFKGALILHSLEQIMGEKPFFELLKEVSTSEVSSTQELLDLITLHASENISDWLEDQLRSR
jgi:hypothetical protein